jgi:hypothetical protein
MWKMVYPVFVLSWEAIRKVPGQDPDVAVLLVGDSSGPQNLRYGRCSSKSS